MKCSTKTEALKIFGSKTGKQTTGRSGPALNGRPRKKKGSKNIRAASPSIYQPVCVVSLHLRFPIIRTLKSTESPNTSTLTIHDGSVIVAIRERTKENSPALSAGKFAQSWPIRRAIDVLARAISSELRTEKMTETREETRSRGRKAGSSGRSKSSTSIPANG